MDMDNPLARDGEDPRAARAPAATGPGIVPAVVPSSGGGPVPSVDAKPNPLIRPRKFPVDYREQQPYTIELEPDCDGVLVVVPEGLNENYKLDFRVELYAGKAMSPVIVTPRGRGMMIFDLLPRYKLDLAELERIVREEWLKGGGKSPGPGAVNGKP